MESIEIKDISQMPLFELNSVFFEVGHEIWKRYGIIMSVLNPEPEAVLQLKKLITYSGEICKRKNELITERLKQEIDWNNKTQKFRENFLKEYPWIQEYEDHKNIFIDEFLKEIKIHDFIDKVEETFLTEDHLRKLKLMTMVNIMYVIFWPDKCYIWVSGRKEAEIVQKYLQEKVNIKSTIESKPGRSYYPHPLVVTFDPKYRKTLVYHIEDANYV